MRMSARIRAMFTNPPRLNANRPSAHKIKRIIPITSNKSSNTTSFPTRLLSIINIFISQIILSPMSMGGGGYFDFIFKTVIGRQVYNQLSRRLSNSIPLKGDGYQLIYPSSPAISRPPSRCTWRCVTTWPPCGPQLMVTL